MRTARMLPAAFAVLLAACGAESPQPDGTGGNTSPPTGPPTPTAVSDETVFQRAAYTSDWVYYRFSTDTLTAGANSPHVARIRARYNPAAEGSLDSLGMVDPGKPFADGSLIAKEIYLNGSLTGLAVMYKLVNDPNAGHGGWLWGEYDPAGLPRQSVAADGSYCHDCHIAGVDHTRMNDAHP